MKVHPHTIISLSLITYLLVPIFPVQAQSVRNEIKIETNTGGNVINTETDGSQVTTGDTTTSVSIKNNTTQQATTSGNSQTDSQTNVSIESSGGGTNTVQIQQNGTRYELNHENDQARLVVTDESGTIIREESFASGNRISLTLENGTLEVQPAGEDFTLEINGARAYTSEALRLDETNQMVVLQLANREAQVKFLPDYIVQKVQDEHIVSQIKTNIRLSSGNVFPVYSFEGSTRKRLLGVLPVHINQQVQISAEDGTVTQILPLTLKDVLLNIISF